MIEPGEFSLELKVKVINVRYDSRSDILEKSPSLNGYAYLISLIEKYIYTAGMNRDNAIHTAIEQCIKEGVLADFLKEHFQEVAKMFAIEYNQEDEYYAIRADAREEGMVKGMEKGIEKGMEKGKIELYFTKLKYSVKEIADEMNLGEDVVNAILNNLGLI